MKEKVDLIITGGTIYTVDENFSTCEAVAVKDGLIVAVGNHAEIAGKYDASNTIDLKGATMYPGFNDAHCHLYMLGIGLKRVDLRGATSFDDVLERLSKRYEEEKPLFLSGEGWDQNLWSSKEFPDNSRLNELFPDIPVVLERVDFHAVIANNKAIEMLGIKPGDPSIPEGEAVMKNGRFTGVFLEDTGSGFFRILPEDDKAFVRDVLTSAEQECFKYGLTSISSAGGELSVLEVLDSMYTEGTLKIRTDNWMTPTPENLSRFTKPYVNGRLKIGTVKLFIDGALGSRGALMLEPYSDMKNTIGLQVITDEELEKACAWAYEHGFQVATHCIGDAANRKGLEHYKKFLPKGNDLRWRIEHSQIIDPADFNTFGEYGIVPSIQSTHATSDMLWAVDRIGARIKTAYAYQQLLDQLGWLPNGTDFPVEAVNPIYTFFAAVYRKNLDFVPEEGFQMENALSKENALRSMTIWAAKASFEEDVKGSIQPGKYADFVVLDRDIMTVDEKEVPQTKVLMTFVGGEQVYSLK
ncbi:MAG: amidohydrolase [Prevotellaceae bacterium]|nr:amidohydrolase [Prevotellaceae bacterium]